MSDTCWLELIFARKDLDKFNELLKDEIWEGTFWDEDIGDESIVHAIIHEANRGWSIYIPPKFNSGLTFHGSHSAGGNYGPMAFACYKGDYADVGSDVEGTPMIRVHKGGIDVQEYKWALKYYAILERIENDPMFRTINAKQ